MSIVMGVHFIVRQAVQHRHQQVSDIASGLNLHVQCYCEHLRSLGNGSRW